MNRPTTSFVSAAFALAVVGFQVACSHGQVTPAPEAVKAELASQGQLASRMCARVGIRLVVLSRKEQRDPSLHYEFAEVPDAECTEENVWNAKR